MKTRKLKYTFVFALFLSACAMEGTCKVGEEEGCPRGAECYGGQNPRRGSLGVCAQLPEPVLCSAQAEGVSPNAVQAPLAASGGRLLFGTSLGDTEANSSLYVFDTAACAFVGSLHTGVVQGPMVALGGDALVALALGDGGPEGTGGRSGQRLALVDVGEAEPGFVYESERDCAAGDGGSSKEAVFEHGLFLMSAGSSHGQGPWRLGAPANAEDESFLVAYEPHVAKTEERCNIRNTNWDKTWRVPFSLTPVQGSGDNEFISMYGEASPDVGVWWFHEVNLSWDLRPRLKTGGFKNPSGIAGGGVVQGEEQLWLSGSGLVRLYTDDRAPERVLGEHWRTSLAAIDAEGRAYVVVQTGPESHPESHVLKRFANDTAPEEARECFVGDNSPCRKEQQCLGIESQEPQTPGLCQSAPEARSQAFSGAPVGSPLLGQPLEGRAPEVYLLTTSGKVLVFRADSLRLLREVELGIEVSPTAQPVLVGRMLWAVGTSGEIRGLEVGSEGLSRAARWPKAFRDNCNTSSMHSGALVHCF